MLRCRHCGVEVNTVANQLVHVPAFSFARPRHCDVNWFITHIPTHTPLPIDGNWFITNASPIIPLPLDGKKAELDDASLQHLHKELDKLNHILAE